MIGGIGILRMPNFFTRIHAAGMAETMCAPLKALPRLIRLEGFDPRCAVRSTRQRL